MDLGFATNSQMSRSRVRSSSKPEFKFSIFRKKNFRSDVKAWIRSKMNGLSFKPLLRVIAHDFLCKLIGKILFVSARCPHMNMRHLRANFTSGDSSTDLGFATNSRMSRSRVRSSSKPEFIFQFFTRKVFRSDVKAWILNYNLVPK